ASDPKCSRFVDVAYTPVGFGGKGIRTPDFQLAKLALYQLSYAPEKLKMEGRRKITESKISKAGMGLGFKCRRRKDNNEGHRLANRLVPCRYAQMYQQTQCG